MSKTSIFINKKEYNVPERVCHFVESNIKHEYQKKNVFEYLELILKSDNYKNGKIPESILLASTIDYLTQRAQVRWINLLTSKVFGEGLVSYETASKLTKIARAWKWSQIDEKYNKGIITKEDLEQLFNLVNQYDDDDDSQHIGEAQINIIGYVLTSRQYEKGQISKESIQSLYELSREKSEKLINTFLELFIEKNYIDDEMLKLIMEEESELIRTIIYYIITTPTTERERKKILIQVMSNLSKEDKEGLEKECKSYIDNRIVENIEKFAACFVTFKLSFNNIVIGGEIARKLEQ